MRVLQALTLVVVTVVVGLPVGLSTFVHSERHIVIGAHDSTVVPALDGYATIDTGPLLPQLRIPAGTPGDLGVNISLGSAEVDNLDQLVARDAVIASQPEGEIANVRSALTDMLTAAVLRGVGAGLIAAVAVAVAWRAVGARRRAEIWAAVRHPTWRRGVLAGVTAAAVVAAGALLVVPERGQARPPESWVPLVQVFPEIPSDPVLDQVQVVVGTATRGGKALVQGALKTYRDSVEFYGALALRASTADVRKPADDETTALVVTDRHDNIGMDPVARAIAGRARAGLLLDLGDDTSNGGSWEEFSINSLAREFDDFDVAAVAGNHDQGEFVTDTMRDRGFEVLDGDPVDVDGIRLLGDSDPRSSGLTAGYTGNESDNISAIEQQDEQLTKTACDDGRVSVLMVHSSASARKASASGCVDLVLSGHLHRQVGPTVEEGENGRSTTSLTTGSTGGAVYAFALGSKLRRKAQVTIVTFKDGVPVGLQSVSFEPGGTIDVADYFAIDASPRAASAGATDPDDGTGTAKPDDATTEPTP